MAVELTDYEVTTPAGETVKFRGPSSMSDAQVTMRAQQEAAFQAKRIPSTKTEGYGDALAKESGNVGKVIGLGGALIGQPEIVAAAPLLGRGLQAVGEKMAGRDATPTSTSEVLGLAAQGAVAGYAPMVAGKAMEGFAGSTVAHQLPSGQWVKGVSGHGVLPWGVRTAGEVAAKVAPKLTTPAARVGFAAAVSGAIDQTQAAINQGVSPSQAAMKASGGDPSIFSAVMSHFMSGGGK